MTTEPVVPLAKKLQNLRRVLWLSFAGVSVSAAVLMFLANFFLVARSPDIVSTGRDAVMPMLLLGLGVVFVIGAIGTVCLVVYYVVKRRLERDDEIFL
ncbi:hypothetical protein ACFL6R_01320 [Gemmatimonadota bacterium]